MFFLASSAVGFSLMPVHILGQALTWHTACDVRQMTLSNIRDLAARGARVTLAPLWNRSSPFSSIRWRLGRRRGRRSCVIDRTVRRRGGGGDACELLSALAHSSRHLPVLVRVPRPLIPQGSCLHWQHRDNTLMFTTKLGTQIEGFSCFVGNFLLK